MSWDLNYNTGHMGCWEPGRRRMGLDVCSLSMCVFLSSCSRIGRGYWMRKWRYGLRELEVLLAGLIHPVVGYNQVAIASSVLSHVAWPQGPTRTVVLTLFPFRFHHWWLESILACKDVTCDCLNHFLCCVIYIHWSCECCWAAEHQRLSIYTKDSCIPQTCRDAFACLYRCAVSTKACVWRLEKSEGNNRELWGVSIREERLSCVCACLSMYMYVCVCVYVWASLVAQLVKNLPAMQETPVRFLGLEDSQEKG